MVHFALIRGKHLISQGNQVAHRQSDGLDGMRRLMNDTEGRRTLRANEGAEGLYRGQEVTYRGRPYRVERVYRAECMIVDPSQDEGAPGACVIVPLRW